ncbi:MAG TPA: polyprenyl synthetase family protein [Candidatus Fermentibacter daniensis]|nr:polyprenyl synthetase family protein [Candidatus Fermentibacter daniensis]HOR06363.1 polyprenyl synthetase family protein [Candidatus Fermentibacter daniensis]HPK51967.1 polyprenyl synthetase family protein [Candidatus Fermentibacter daniensis]
MPESDFSELLESISRSAEWVDDALRPFLADYGRQSLLPGAASHCLEAGGKRIRPFLVRAACRAFGGDDSRAVHAAAAVEMVHTYSLIHDDLPAMDDDSTRRGRPTLHVLHGSPQAVLAGDFLLSGAFTILLRGPQTPSILGAMTRHLAEAAGASFLVGGQFMDMAPPPAPDEDWARRMIDGKTSAMIRVSLELGALAGSCPPSALAAVSAAGDRLGLLFQITDDLLDVSGTEEEMGKAVGKDAARGKANLVTIMGLDESRRLVGRISEDLDSEFSRMPGDWSEVRMLSAYLPGRRS